MARWARMSNVLVREVTDQDPTGRFTSDITWMQITPATTVGGDITVVAPRWTYVDNIFYPPQYGNATVYIQSGAQFTNEISFTGNAFINGDGVIDDSCWLPLAVVNVSATNSTAHFVSYSSHIFDVALNVGNSIVYINSPINSYSGGGEFVSGGSGNATGEPGPQGPPGSANTPGNPDKGGFDPTGGPQTDQPGCFISSVPILMPNGTTTPISSIAAGDILQGDLGPVTVLSVHNRTLTTPMIDFNGLGYWITSEQAMLTDQGWGAFDVLRLRELEPLTYQQLLSQNNNRPLVTIQEGMKLGTWKDNQVVFEKTISDVRMTTQYVQVWWLNVSGDEHFIANGIVVHNQKI